MTNVLFTFRRAVKDPNNETQTIVQDNYINPFQVISAFWEKRKDGKTILNIFTLTYTFTLPETTGKIFMKHMEDCLRLSLPSTETIEPQQRERKQRPVMDATVVEDLDLSTAPDWAPAQ